MSVREQAGQLCQAYNTTKKRGAGPRGKGETLGQWILGAVLEPSFTPGPSKWEEDQLLSQLDASLVDHLLDSSGYLKPVGSHLFTWQSRSPR
ncbi:hypothetical protein VTK73DRAFT_5687 [Phialemonium thermophilum]|uniref:Uncharacterized protein n=1 Tax=Phialemonium thermophilum TaxID=223376 RepID=A0ABR3WMB6_9PEZI